MKISLAIATAVTCGTALILCPSGAGAQGVDPDSAEPPAELAEFRAAFEKAAESRSAPARGAFAADLDDLAKQRALRGDYEGAIRARDRRLELLGGSATPGADPPPDEGEIVIDLPTGNRSGGGLKYDTIGNKFVGFTKADQNIKWDINKTAPGLYSAVVTYSCAEPTKTTNSNGNTITKTSGGVFTLEEATSLATAGSPPLRRSVVPTGGWNKTVTRNIGKIKITGSRTTLLLTVKSAGDLGLMHLYGLRLVPESASSGSQPDEPATELMQLRSKFRSAILSKTTPIISAYGTKLRVLRERFSDANDIQAAYEVQKEFTAAEKLSKDPTLIFRNQPDP